MYKLVKVLSKCKMYGNRKKVLLFLIFYFLGILGKVIKILSSYVKV